MGKLFASYDLGLNSLMLRYNLRYYARFGSWDRESLNGLGIRNCLQWIIDDLVVLMPGEHELDSSRQIATIVNEFQTFLANGLLDEHGVDQTDPQITGDNTVRRRWSKLATLTDVPCRGLLHAVVRGKNITIDSMNLRMVQGPEACLAALDKLFCKRT